MAPEVRVFWRRQVFLYPYAFSSLNMLEYTTRKCLLCCFHVGFLCGQGGTWGILGKLAMKECVNKWKMNVQSQVRERDFCRLNISWNLLWVVKHVSALWMFACCFIFTFNYYYYIPIMIIIWYFDIGCLCSLPSFFWMLALQLSLLCLNPPPKSSSLGSAQAGLWPSKHLSSSETL